MQITKKYGGLIVLSLMSSLGISTVNGAIIAINPPSSACPSRTGAELHANAAYPSATYNATLAFATIVDSTVSPGKLVSVGQVTHSLRNCNKNAASPAKATQTKQYQRGSQWSVNGDIAGGGEAWLGIVKANVEARVGGSYGQSGMTSDTYEVEITVAPGPCEEEKMTFDIKQYEMNIVVHATLTCGYTVPVLTNSSGGGPDTIAPTGVRTTRGIGGAGGTNKSTATTSEGVRETTKLTDCCECKK